VCGLLGDLSVQFLLDTGAAVSVVCYDSLGEPLQQHINPIQEATFGANGSPLDVVGQVKATIKLMGINTISCFQWLDSYQLLVF